MKSARKWAPVLAIAAVAVVGSARAEAAAINLTSPGDHYGSGLYTLGFEFQVVNPMSVGALGVYDYLQDGLENPAQVAIWLATGGAPLASVVVPGGTGGTLDNFFRYADIAPLQLNPGVDYVVGAFLRGGIASSLNTAQGGSGAFDPNVLGIQDRFSPFDSAFGFPGATNGFAGGAWLGGNFATAVPEPASLALLTLGFGLCARRLRRTA